MALGSEVVLCQAKRCVKRGHLLIAFLQGCRYNPSVFRMYQVLLLVLTAVQCLIVDIMQQGVQNLDGGKVIERG